MNILEEIVVRKRTEVAGAKRNTPVSELEASPFFKREIISLKSSIEQRHSPAIIAEFKRRSPSKGEINSRVKPAQIAKDYQNAGVTAMSVLTDTVSFGGATHDLIMARQQVNIPLLRKDFMIDPYQIIEAKAIGADAILLIAACLSPNQLKELAQTAQQYGLDVLMEVHSQAELESHLNKYVSIVGVNNRNLKTFDVSIDTSLKLAELIPNEFVKISESGLKSAKEIVTLHKVGYQGFLIGETFMKSSDPGKSCQEFLQSIDQLLNPKATL
ncbi:indole-3-glycerol phosphate synthase TrpC [Microscilla marina]|uniref:Indole-3-glycerol phosphate synthase n=1 Tax=Microscilla marina ATCC 23134 TaxID=313606 RepID=A1ZFH3_MICM2|nr:indole-3-glycerol phosphate synthase TrpC [Microscilla marina]EAY30747.1 indole-3-glycerol phosphate synthase [Microscilla marina ATCC 23134]